MPSEYHAVDQTLDSFAIEWPKQHGAAAAAEVAQEQLESNWTWWFWGMYVPVSGTPHELHNNGGNPTYKLKHR